MSKLSNAFGVDSWWKCGVFTNSTEFLFLKKIRGSTALNHLYFILASAKYSWSDAKVVFLILNELKKIIGSVVYMIYLFFQSQLTLFDIRNLLDELCWWRHSIKARYSNPDLMTSYLRWRYICDDFISASFRKGLGGWVVKASVFCAEGPGFESQCHLI